MYVCVAIVVCVLSLMEVVARPPPCVCVCTREDVLSPHVRKSIYAYRYDSRKRADVTEGGGGESVYEYARAYVGRM